MFPSPSTSAAPHIPFNPPPEPEPADRFSFDDKIEKIQSLPESARLPKFKDLVAAADVNAGQSHGAQLIAISRQLKHVPQHQRMEAFSLLIVARDTLEEPFLTALGRQLEHLPQDQRWEVFNLLIDEPGARGEAHFAALAGQIGHLEPERRREAFDRLLTTTDVYIETLGEQIGCLGKPDRFPAFDAIARKIGQAADIERRGDRYVALAGQIPQLRSQHMAKGYALIVDKISGLDAEERRFAHLKALIRQIEPLPQEAGLAVFTRILHGVDKLGKEGHLTKQSWLVLFDMLKNQACQLSPYGYDRELAQIRFLDAAERLNALPEPPQLPPERFQLPVSALENIKELAESSREDPAAVAAALMERQRDGAHIGLWLAGLMNRYPHAGAAPLKAYLELADALRAGGHLRREDIHSLLLPEKEEETYLPISAAVASHWQSSAAQPFVSALANATPESEKAQVVARMSLPQSDQRYPQIRMQYPADFFKQIKRSITNLPASEQDTPALRLLSGHGLIPPYRELGKIARKLPDVGPSGAARAPTIDAIAASIDAALPGVRRKEAEKQKQDAELEKARAAFQQNWQAAERAPARPPALAATLVAGISGQLQIQRAVARARRQQSMAQQERDRAARREMEMLPSRQRRSSTAPGVLDTLMLASQAVGSSRSSADMGAAPAYVPLPENRQPDIAPSESRRALGRLVARQAAAAAENRHFLATQRALWRAPATSDLPALNVPVPAQSSSQQSAAAGYFHENGHPRTQTE